MAAKTNKTAAELKEKLSQEAPKVEKEVKAEAPKVEKKAPKAEKMEDKVLTDFQIMQNIDTLAEEIAKRVAENKITSKPWKSQQAWARELSILADRIRRFNRFEPKCR